jgi:hypothetical protein
MTKGWLLQHNDLILGDLFPYDWDFPWVYCKFTPTPAFAPYRALFDEEALLSDEADSDDKWQAWEQLYNEIDALGLQLIPQTADDKRVFNFLLHIDGGEAWFRGDLE